MKSEEAWLEAVEHFYDTKHQYESLRGMPGVNVELALTMVFKPLADRYVGGDRSDELWQEMRSVK